MPRDVTTSPLQVIAETDSPANGFARLTGRILVNLPRYPGYMQTPSLAVVRKGAIIPFPGSGWNTWKPGQEGHNSFVCISAMHPHRNRLWIVDQGRTPETGLVRGGPKLVELDPISGDVLGIIRFSLASLPETTRLTTMRRHADTLVISDIGRGGFLLHDLRTGKSRKRLCGHPALRSEEDRGTGPHTGPYPAVRRESALEISPDGTRLTWATPTGPLRSLPVSTLLSDMSDDDLAERITVISTGIAIGGSAMDDRGNMYLSDTEARQIHVLAPDGQRAILLQDDRLRHPAALFLSTDGRLFIPCPQTDDLPCLNAGVDRTETPFEVLAIPLPPQVNGITLGGPSWSLS